MLKSDTKWYWMGSKMVQELQQYSIPVRRYSQQYYVSSSQSPSTFIILRQNISSRFTHAHHVLTASMLAVKTSMYGEPLAFTHLKVRVLLVQYIRKHTFFFCAWQLCQTHNYLSAWWCGTPNYREMFNNGILKEWCLQTVHETYSTIMYKQYRSARLLTLHRNHLTSGSLAVEIKNIAIICMIRKWKF